jgi:hypothetical protein
MPMTESDKNRLKRSKWFFKKYFANLPRREMLRWARWLRLSIPDALLTDEQLRKLLRHFYALQNCELQQEHWQKQCDVYVRKLLRESSKPVVQEDQHGVS